MTIALSLSMSQTQAGAQLRAREAELLTVLARNARAPDQPAGVVDFKDLAEGEIQSELDDAAGARAAEELQQVTAALHRLAAGRYGTCLDCGEAIDARRLAALPASAFCAACQQAHELGDQPVP